MRFGDIPMRCRLCGHVARLYDCEPDVDGDGSLGCPISDCGGIVVLGAEPEVANAPKS